MSPFPHGNPLKFTDALTTLHQVFGQMYLPAPFAPKQKHLWLSS